MPTKKKKSVEELEYECGMCYLSDTEVSVIAKYMINEWVWQYRIQQYGARRAWGDVFDAMDSGECRAYHDKNEEYKYSYFPICEACVKEYKIPKKYLIEYFPTKKMKKEIEWTKSWLAGRADSKIRLLKKILNDFINSKELEEYAKRYTLRQLESLQWSTLKDKVKFLGKLFDGLIE